MSNSPARHPKRRGDAVTSTIQPLEDDLPAAPRSRAPCGRPPAPMRCRRVPSSPAGTPSPPATAAHRMPPDRRNIRGRAGIACSRSGARVAALHAGRAGSRRPPGPCPPAYRDHRLHRPHFSLPWPCDSTFRSRDAVCVRVEPIVCHPPPNEGWMERRDGAGCVARRDARERADAGHPWRAVACGTPRRLRGASRPLAIGDARLSALQPWRFMMAPVRASGFGISSEARAASSSQPGLGCPAGGSRASRGWRLRAAAAERHSLLHLPNVSGRRPSVSRDDSRIGK